MKQDKGLSTYRYITKTPQCLSQTGSLTSIVILQPNVYKTSPGTLLNQTANGSVATWKFLLRTLEDPYMCSSLTWTVQSSRTTPAAWGSAAEQGSLDVLDSHRSSLLCMPWNLTYKTHSLRFSPCRTSLGIWMLSFTRKLLKNSSPATGCTVELCKKKKKYKKISNDLEYDARMTKENSWTVCNLLLWATL